MNELESQKKYEEALGVQKQKYESQFSDLHNRVRSRLVPTAIKAALASIEDLAPEAASDVPSLLANKVALNEDMEPIVLGDDGKPLLDKETMKPISVEAFVKEFVEARPYLRLSSQSKTTGLKHGSKSGGGWDIERAISDSNYAAEWMEADREGYDEATRNYFTLDKMRKLASERIK